jgi:PAS domain S-box-containing protein
VPDGLLRIPAILERGVSDVVSAFDAFGVGIYCVDLDGRFTYINPAGQELLGWDTEELIGSDAHDAVHHSRPDGSSFPRAVPAPPDGRERHLRTVAGRSVLVQGRVAPGGGADDRPAQ